MSIQYAFRTGAMTNLPPMPLRMRSADRRPSRQTNYQDRSILKRADGWQSWVELSVRVYQLPANISTKELYKQFISEGSITTIDIFEDVRGLQQGSARIRFKPPPRRPFWDDPSFTFNGEPVRVEREKRSRSFFHPSPVDPSVLYPEAMKLVPQHLDFGFMLQEIAFMNMHTVTATNDAQIGFLLNLLRREIDISFVLSIDHPPPLGRKTHTYRFKVPLPQLERIFEIKMGDNQRALLIPLDTPPSFYRQVHHVNATHEEGATHWNERMAWYRQTDIVSNRDSIKRQSVSLKKDEPIIDIGRWTTYRMVFDEESNDKQVYDKILRALRDYNIKIHALENLQIVRESQPAVWEWIDRKTDNTVAGLRSEFAELIDDTAHLPFSVRYQLEVCISQGYLNEYNLSKEFVDTLANMDRNHAIEMLENIAETKRRYFDDMEIFKAVNSQGSTGRRIPGYCAYARSATITPSTIYYNTPTVETSNRVIRQYSEHNDRFLRVRFTDEKFRGRINSQDEASENEVFTRIKRALANGIDIGDRHYEFLAFGNSQLREHGAYFFASTPGLEAADIRRWMGEFDHIKVVAKHASRLGQCFSTTRAIHGTKVKIVTLEDIKRGGYCFTDGVGKISLFLAKLITAEFGLPVPNEMPPSLYQFRLGGCKGVLALSPDAKTREIHVRPSQEKFGAIHQGLEIIRFSSFAMASLNRQLILILSTLGVQDYIFVKKLKDMLRELHQAMSDEGAALRLLPKNVDFNHMTLTLASIILDGFMRTREPFVMSLLHLWRAWQIKYLKEHSKITVEKGAFLLGCVDETATLKGHFFANQVPPSASEEEHIETLPEIFLQISDPQNRFECRVITGLCLLARNPSLHPGDIRMVKAVDIPDLHHLRDVVVFPQTGDRDVANMCSGGDLDGDDFLVMWDTELFPPYWNWNQGPMDYTPPSPVEVNGAVTTHHITSFFVNYMKNDKLPSIALAHMAFADRSDDGVRDNRCLSLAQLHSLAVDYAKTGVPAKLPRQLRPNQWPHWMEKTHLPREKQYHSTKILGQLFDQVDRVDFTPDYKAPFDERILEAYVLDDDLLAVTAELKQQYDAAMFRVMAQHDIKTEHEIWSTFVMHHARISSDYKFHEEVGRISATLKERFQALCYEKAGGREFEKMGPFVAAMYTVTARQVADAVEQSFQTRTVGGKEIPTKSIDRRSMPLMSFPWLFPRILGRIACGKKAGRSSDGVSKPNAKKRTEALEEAYSGLFRPRIGDVVTEDGVTHQGEVLKLFHDDDSIKPQTDAAMPLSHEARVEAGIQGVVEEDDVRSKMQEPEQHEEWDPESKNFMPMADDLLMFEEDEDLQDGSDHASLESQAGSSVPNMHASSENGLDGPGAVVLSSTCSSPRPALLQTPASSIDSPGTSAVDAQHPSDGTAGQEIPLTRSEEAFTGITEAVEDDEGGEMEEEEEEEVHIDFDSKPSALDELHRIIG